MSDISSLEERVAQIENRNREVESRKAWETSWTRRIVLIGLTYTTLGVYFQFVLQTDPWLNAIVPTLGFWLSTLSLPFIQKLWIKWVYKKGK